MAKEKATQTVVLKKGKLCKSCVRFESKEESAKDVTTSLYLANKAYEALGKPESITVAVQAS